MTDGRLAATNAKTAHGLLRGSGRFEVVGIIDAAHAGQDAADVVPHAPRGVQVFASLEEALQTCTEPPGYLIIGIATKGGTLPGHLREVVLEGVRRGLHVVNGLHETLGDDPRIAAAAASAGAAIHDIRKPRAFADLHFWTGRIMEVGCPIIAVLGLDCAAGKRTTAKLLTEGLRERGLRAEMVYTGQTGWMQGFEFGFIFDATPNDFVCGELEHAIVSCWEARKPDVIFLEGQSGLRNPSGPCGAEYLLAGQARTVILQHVCGRECYVGAEHLGFRIPSVADEIALIRMYGAETAAVTLNTRDVSAEEARRIQASLEAECGLPVADPFVTIEPVLDAVQACLTAFKKKVMNA